MQYAKGRTEMCLSNVYRKDDDENVLMLKNIAKVEADGEKLIFTNLLGIQTELAGVLLNIDLLENIILVKIKEEI